MPHPAYVAPHVKITELIFILNVVIFAVFVVNFPIYSIKFPPTASCTQIGSSFCVRKFTTMREYVTVRPFYTLPSNPSVSCPNYFVSTFSRVLLFFVLLLALNNCNVVSTLCLDQRLS